jgi:hypothetical protein
MKKLLILSALMLSASALSSSAFAADLRCTVGGDSQIGYCDAMIWGKRTAPASFKVENTAKAVSQYIWQSPSVCQSKTTASCAFTAYSFVEYSASVLVLYTDGTYENLNASLRFEDGR